MFLSMKLPTTMQIGGIDPVDLYLVALNSHDGTSAFRLLVSPVRVVCANTQALAIRRAQASFSIRHTSGAKGNIAQARQALGLTFRYVEAFEAEAEKLIAQEMTDAQFQAIIGTIWTPTPDSKRSETIAAQPHRNPVGAVPHGRDQRQHPGHPLGRIPGHHRVPGPLRPDRGQGQPGRSPRRTGRRRR